MSTKKGMLWILFAEVGRKQIYKYMKTKRFLCFGRKMSAFAFMQRKYMIK